ncbi:MAG: hypothetical protein WCO84_06310, partial [bacterium]
MTDKNPDFPNELVEHPPENSQNTRPVSKVGLTVVVVRKLADTSTPATFLSPGFVRRHTRNRERSPIYWPMLG